MTDEKRQAHEERLKHDTNAEILERLLWYAKHFDPFDEDRCIDYCLVKQEVRRRMDRGEEA